MPQSVTDAEIVAATFRNISDAEAFDDMLQAWGKRLADQLSAGNFAELSPEMQRHVHYALEQLQRTAALPLGDTIDRAIDVPAPTMVLSPDGIVVAVNDGGMETFGARQGRALLSGWTERKSEKTLQELLQGAAEKGNRQHAIIRFGSSEAKLAEAFEMTTNGANGNLVVVRSLEVDWNKQIEVILAEAFGLTQAECEVAKAVFRLRGTARIAEQRGASVHTVRAQIKSIQSKTEVNSQVDLVRLLTLLAQQHSNNQTAPGTVWRDPWNNEQIIDGPNGMRIAYSWTGDPNGHDVVVLPSIMHGYAFPERVEDRLRAAGVRLWAIQRPGMGNSSARKYSRETEGDALNTVIEHEAMRDVVLLSLTGTIEPVRCVMRDPHHYKSVIMAGMVSPPTKAVRQMMPRMEVAMNGACRASPLLGRLMVEMSMRNARAKGLEWLTQRMFSNSRADREASTQADMQPLLRDTFAFNLTFDPAMTVWTVGMTLEPWDLPLGELTVPVHALVGTDLAYHHPPSIDEFASQAENFTWEPVEGCGLKMLYQRPDLIADRIIAAINE